MASVREELVAKLDEMTDEQVAELLRYAEGMQSLTLPQDYDPTQDPFLNGTLFFSGEPDLAKRTKSILREELGLRKSSQGDATE